MAGSKATRSPTLHKTTYVAQAVINQPPSPPPQDSADQVVVDTPLHPYLFQPPQIAGSTQVPLVRPQISLVALQPEALTGFQLLRANIGIQCTNELLNNIYNIVWKHNS